MHPHGISSAPPLFSTVRIATLLASLLVSLGSGTNYVRRTVAFQRRYELIRLARYSLVRWSLSEECTTSNYVFVQRTGLSLPPGCTCHTRS